MFEMFSYQVSDLDSFVTEVRYARANTDAAGFAAELGNSLLSEQPSLGDSGLVLVVGDAVGTPLHFRPLGTIH